MVWLQVAVMALATSGGGDAVLLDFHADWCGACRQMGPTIDELALRGYPIRKINTDRDPATATRYKVQGLPCYVMVVDGREVDRVEGAASYGRLLQMFKKAEADRGKASATRGPATMPRDMPTGLATAESIPAEASVAPIFAPGAATARPNALSNNAPVEPASPEGNAAAAGWNPVARRSAPVSDAQFIAASVRLRIEDPKGRSCGTGTIIDARQGWALILTCGHIFRDSDGKGRIEVDLFGEGSPKGVAGELVSYDMDRDVGLLKVRVPGTVAVARVAPADYVLAEGASVVSVGCNNGADPTVERTRVRSRNQFAGPPNVEVEGLPVEGRSGGGLFTPDGLLVGVCNCADPTDNQGLYAALTLVHQELDRAGLSYVCQSPGGVLVTGQNLAECASTVASDAGLVAVGPPSMPTRMPGVDTTVRDEGQLRPTAARSPAEPGGRCRGLTADERAALEEIQRRKAAGCEVICVIRSRSDPLAKSEIVTLDRASPEFLRQLAAQNEAAAVAGSPVAGLPAQPPAAGVPMPTNSRR